MYPRRALYALLVSTLSIEFSVAQYVNNTLTTASPALAVNFPDPALFHHTDGNWYAFSTSGNGVNIQVAGSPSFLNHAWRLFNGTDPLPDPGAWAMNSDVWAPDIIQLDDGRFVMYYAAPSKQDSSKHCVGAATSTSVIGPYLPAAESFACPLDEGGAIDPAGFLDPQTGRLYVVYKVDGNSMNTGGGPCNGNPPVNGSLHSTPIMLQEVSTLDGITKVGSPVQILDRDESDGPLVEAPSLFYNSDTELYFLTFSSNCYDTDLYDISFAYSTCLDSGFVKSKYPLMTTSTVSVRAPGGADMSADGKYALYHGTVGTFENGEPTRYMYAAEADQAGLDMSAIPC